jgi:hypothetical protein
MEKQINAIATAWSYSGICNTWNIVFVVKKKSQDKSQDFKLKTDQPIH